MGFNDLTNNTTDHSGKIIEWINWRTHNRSIGIHCENRQVSFSWNMTNSPPLHSQKHSLGRGFLCSMGIVQVPKVFPLKMGGCIWIRPIMTLVNIIDHFSIHYSTIVTKCNYIIIQWLLIAPVRSLRRSVFIGARSLPTLTLLAKSFCGGDRWRCTRAAFATAPAQALRFNEACPELSRCPRLWR